MIDYKEKYESVVKKLESAQGEINTFKYENGHLAHECNRLSAELVSIRHQLERSNTECLGFATNGFYEWPIRDELIGNITKTLMADRKEI